jgi:hypothetical protein
MFHNVSFLELGNKNKCFAFSKGNNVFFGIGYQNALGK